MLDLQVTQSPLQSRVYRLPRIAASYVHLNTNVERDIAQTQALYLYSQHTFQYNAF